jgi:hypothetical protein
MLKAAFILCLTLATHLSADNPPLPGFDQAGSDPEAIALADQTMERMGGRQNWDATRYITWRFFGKRLHVWDKWTGDIRVEADGGTVLMNIHTKKGKAWKNSAEITNSDALQQALDGAYKAWINDSYWLVMPYKLKDSGVTLKYLGAGHTEDERAADILELTFKEVGVSPQNKYHVYIDQQEKLVTQWDFYPTTDTAEPRFKGSWANWQTYGKILLSDNRGERGHSGVAVFDELPQRVFTHPDPVGFSGK